MATPEQRRVAAQIASNTRWAKVSAEERAMTGHRAQAGLTRRFEREVDPEGILPPDELARRVANARAAYFARLRLMQIKQDRKQ